MTSGSNQNLYHHINIRNNFQYGDMGKVLLLHGQIYHQEYGFNHEFEVYVAEGLAEFAREYKENRSRLWVAEINNDIIGSIAILERSPIQAQLRWFLVHPDYRGLKLGQRLCREALNFCRGRGYEKVVLWTLDNLAAARAIYNKNGFKVMQKKEHILFGQPLIEEYHVLDLRRMNGLHQ